MGGKTTFAFVGGGGGLLIAAAQTKPEEAASNIAAWLKVLGADNLPSFLTSGSTDGIVTIIGTLLVAIAAFFYLRRALKAPIPASSSKQGHEPMIPEHARGAGMILGGSGSRVIGGTFEDNYGPGIADLGGGNLIQDVVSRGNNRQSADVEALIAAKRQSTRDAALIGARPVPDLPVTVNNLGAYVRGFPRVRQVTAMIVATIDEPVSSDKEAGYDSYVEMARALGLETIAHIDAALAREEVLVIRLAAYLIPERIRSDFSLYCLFMVLGGRLGAEAYYELGKGLKLWSNSRGFAKELEEIYGQITSY